MGCENIVDTSTQNYFETSPFKKTSTILNVVKISKLNYLNEMSPQKEYPSILQLPVEILIEIFNYITDHRYIPFVCHRFYQVICLMERNFCILSIKDESTVSRKI